MSDNTVTINITGVTGTVRQGECTTENNARLDITYNLLDGTSLGIEETYSSVKVESLVATPEDLNERVINSICLQVLGRCLAGEFPVINGLNLRLNQGSKNHLRKVFSASQTKMVYIRKVGVLNHSIGVDGERHGDVFITYRLSENGLVYRIELNAHGVTDIMDFNARVVSKLRDTAEDVVFDEAGETYLRNAYYKWLAK